MKQIGLTGLILTLIVGLFIAPAFAGNTSTSGYIKVEVGKTKPMRINKQPDLVLVGNPGIADIILETNNRVFLVGLRPGETNLLMYDANGKLMLSQNIVVTRQKTRHVIVHRGIQEQTVSCANNICTPVGSGVGRASAGKTANTSTQVSSEPTELVGEQE